MLNSFWDWITEHSGFIGAVLSFVGLLVSLLGFYLLWIQTKRIRSSSEAANVATAQALAAISDTDTISDLAAIRERLKKVQIAVRSGRYETALNETQTLREGLHQLKSRRGFATDESKMEIQEMVTFLRKIQTHFEKWLADDAYPVPGTAMNQTLSDLSTKTSEWIEKMRYVRGGKEL